MIVTEDTTPPHHRYPDNEKVNEGGRLHVLVGIRGGAVGLRLGVRDNDKSFETGLCVLFSIFMMSALFIKRS